MHKSNEIIFFRGQFFQNTLPHVKNAKSNDVDKKTVCQKF